MAEKKLDRLLEELGGKVRVRHRIVPVFGSVPWRFSQGPWAKDGVAGRVLATQQVAAAHGRVDVSGACWQKAAPASSWAPALAIKAVFALESGTESGPGYQRALRERFFVGEANIALRSVQMEVAESMRLARGPIEARLDDGTALASVWEDYAEKERLRLQGSPSYVFDGGRAILYGNFDYGILHATVDQLIRGRDPGGTAC